MDILTEQEKKLLLMREAKICWKLIAKEFKCNKSTAYLRHQKALSKILHSDKITL